MVEYVELEEAKQHEGLRLVVVSGVPSPWGEAAKGILHMKQIPYVAVRMPPGDNPVTRWTGEASAPVAMYRDEAPRSGWASILLLAERLAPEPRLIPEDPDERALLFGLAHEICGEMGLGWARRLVGVDEGLASDGERGFPKPIAEYLAGKYGWYPGCGPEAKRRVVEVLRLLTGRLQAQRVAGSRYLLGDRPTAADVYFAAFMALLKPLPPEQCPMPDALRATFESLDDETLEALDPVLLAHRDFVYREHLELPLSL